MMDSLDLLSYTVRQERTAQLSHFDALDSKAGIVLGFAAALIALSSEVSRWFRHAGVIGLGLSATVAAIAFLPRNLPLLHAGELRAYLRADVDFTKLRLHDTQLAMIQTGSSELKRKARLLTLSVLLLGAGRLLWQQASSWEDTMADGTSPPRDGQVPSPAGQIPPPPPYQPDPKLITYIERDQRPKRDKRER